MPGRQLAAAFLLAAALLVAAGCGAEGTTGREGADLERGRELFVSGIPEEGRPSCGSCHVLADAGTQGLTGPNLDHAFGYSREQGFDESSFYEVTLMQIALAAPPMPADIFEGQDAVDVAAYVASVAGRDEQTLVGAGTAGAAGGGANVFLSAGCGSCHALADANTTGTIGPDLDALQPSEEQVVEIVTNGRGQMPSFADTLTEEQIQAVAEYVSGAAGRG